MESKQALIELCKFEEQVIDQWVKSIKVAPLILESWSDDESCAKWGKFILQKAKARLESRHTPL